MKSVDPDFASPIGETVLELSVTSTLHSVGAGGIAKSCVCCVHNYYTCKHLKSLCMYLASSPDPVVLVKGSCLTLCLTTTKSHRFFQ